MALIDIDREFIDLFFNITNAVPPASPTLLDMKKQLIEIVDAMKELNKNAKKPINSKVFGSDDDDQRLTEEAILVVDDLGVITYQLKVLLSQFEMDIDCSQEIYDAVSKYKKRKYKYVVMDLFIPTEREGFILLTELKKMSEMWGVNTVVGVITASPRKEIEQQCRTRGADFFLEKNNDWQNSLTKIMSDYITVEEDDF